MSYISNLYYEQDPVSTSCVSIKVKPVFMKRPSGELKEELERLEIGRVLQYIGAQQEEAVAQEIVREFEHRKELL